MTAGKKALAAAVLAVLVGATGALVWRSAAGLAGSSASPGAPNGAPAVGTVQRSAASVDASDAAFSRPPRAKKPEPKPTPAAPIPAPVALAEAPNPPEVKDPEPEPKPLTEKQQKLAELRDAFRKRCVEKMKRLPYYDLSYGVEISRIDSRWKQNETKDGEEQGVMFSATFSVPEQQGSTIELVARKYLHKSLDGKSEYSVPFDRAGKSVKTSDRNGMLEGSYLETMKTYREVRVDQCQAPAKVRQGPSDRYASVTGVNPSTKALERTDFYVWTAPNTTWVVTATYTGVFAKSAADFQDKVQDVMQATAELKNVPE